MELQLKPDLAALDRAQGWGHEQFYTPGRNTRSVNFPPSYFLIAHCLHAPSRDLPSTWHVRASRES